MPRIRTQLRQCLFASPIVASVMLLGTSVTMTGCDNDNAFENMGEEIDDAADDAADAIEDAADEVDDAVDGH